MDFIKETKRLWDIYFFGSEEDCAALMENAVPDCVIIGTGKHELYHNLQSFSETLGLEIEERKNMKFQYKDFWCEKKEISPDVCFVYGGLYIWWENKEQNVSINMDSRFTVLYQYMKDRWKIVHIHQSMPNLEQGEDEYYPKKLLDLYYAEKNKADKLTVLAENDPLTGLFNYQTFQKIFYESQEKDMWLIAIDLDDFKQINDTYGHLVGNQVLQGAADAFKSSVHSDDIVCRMGGDEFLVLCYEIGDSKELSLLLDQMKKAVETMCICNGHPISISVGATAVKRKEAFDAAFKRADAALYRAKKRGKNRWEIHEPV